MKFAFYKASKGTFIDKVVDIWTGCYGYSHVELVFSDGMSFSASPREGKVRFKNIKFNPDRWEFVELNISLIDEMRIRAQAQNLVDKKYDWMGILFWFVIPINKQDTDKWWCSEIGEFLVKKHDFRIDPNVMAKKYGLTKQPFSCRMTLTKRY